MRPIRDAPSRGSVFLCAPILFGFLTYAVRHLGSEMGSKMRD